MDGAATLRVDLLTAAEQERDAKDATLRFDVPRIAAHLMGATEWAAHELAPDVREIALVGASTGAAAALVAAASRPETVRAVVARGGRVDLAGDALGRIRAPTLLIVGGADEQTLLLNREAMRRIRAPVRLEIVANAGHTFEEPGALGQVGELTRRWLRARFSFSGRIGARLATLRLAGRVRG